MAEKLFTAYLVLSEHMIACRKRAAEGETKNRRLHTAATEDKVSELPQVINLDDTYAGPGVLSGQNRGELPGPERSEYPRFLWIR